MKPTREQTLQFARDAGLVVRAGEISPEFMGSVSEGYFDLAAVAYEAGVEKGKADYEREHLRHAVPLSDALRVMQEQVAEACAKLAENRKPRFSEFSTPSRDIAQEIRDGEWRKHLGETK
jgi:hypothetical protein